MRPLLLLMMLAISGNSLAQHALRITIMDSIRKEPVAGAAIYLYRAEDYSDTTTVVSEANGKAIILVKQVGLYILQIISSGYQPSVVDLLIDTSLIQRTIYLQPQLKTLKEVVVTAEKTSLEILPGRKVLHIGNDIVAAGGSVSDAISRIPSVETGSQGQVSIRGSSQIKILINGRETKKNSLSLSQIPVELIERIEVITAPSAKYSAEGSAAIINVIYKKNNKDKFKLQASMYTGLPERYSFSSDLAYKKKSWNFYSNINHRFLTGTESESSSRLPDAGYTSLTAFSTKGYTTTSSYFSEINTGITYSMDTATSFSVDMLINRSVYKGAQDQFYFFTSPTFISIDIANLHKESENEFSYTTSFQKKFALQRSIQMKYSLNGEVELNKESYNIHNSKIDGTPLANNVNFSATKEKLFIHEWQMDFIWPLKGWGTAEWGAKTDYNKYSTRQSLDYTHRAAIDQNDFSIRQFKQAAYLLFKRKMKKIQFELGQRVEWIRNKSVQRSSNEYFVTRNFGFFPNVQLQYATVKDIIAFSYSKRVNQPNFFDVNPYILYNSPLHITTGNPYLQPSISHAYELSYDKTFNTVKTNTTLYIRKSVNTFQKTTIALNDSVTKTFPVNYSTIYTAGIESMARLKLGQWYETQLQSSVYLIRSKSQSYSNTLASYTRWEQNFTFKKEYKFQAIGFYRAPYRIAQEKRKEVYYLNIGLRKQVLQKKANITINVSDVFNTDQSEIAILGEGFQLKTIRKWQTRRLQLGFTYTFR